MNKKIIASAVLVSLLASTGAAFAQGRDERGDRGREQRATQDDRGQGQLRGQEYRRDERRDERREEFRREERREGWGAGPYHHYYRGGYLPREARHYHYVVNDWRGHYLYAPPRGYYWVQSGADYLLVAIATGLIVETVLHR